MAERSNTSKNVGTQNKLSDSRRMDHDRKVSQADIVKGSGTPSSTDDGVGGSGSEFKDTFVDATTSGPQNQK